MNPLNPVKVEKKKNIYVNPSEYENIIKRNKEFLLKNKLYIKGPQNTSVYLNTKARDTSADMKKIVNLENEI